MRSALDRLGPGDDRVRIGIVDGIPDLSLPGFAKGCIDVEATMRLDTDSAPDAHGTEICSLLFDSVTGLAVGCTGLVLPVFFAERPNAGGLPRASQMDVARALYMGAERQATILNVSAGQRSATAEAGRHLEDALELCHRRRILVVAAAGNDGCACLHVPAAVPTVLAIGAMDDGGRPIAASNFGESYATNGILAPGADLDVTTTGGARTRRTGTSYATAVVAAVAARMLSAARREGFGLDAIDIRSILLETADPCDEAADGDCARILAGKLNVPAAMERLHQRGRREGSRLVPGFAGPPQPAGRELTMITETLAQSVLDAPIAASRSASLPLADGVQQSCGGKGGCACGGNKAGCSCGKHAHDDETHGARQSAAPPASSEAVERSASLTQQGCGCGGGKQEPQKVYSVGALWFDFGNEARYDAIVQQMGDPVAANNPRALLDFLSDNLSFASGITFILMQDQIPVYAIQPAGPFALDVYRDMLDAMRTSIDPTGDLQRVAIPGLVHGTTRLMNGMVLPVVYPDIRGMVKWRAPELAAAAKAAVGDDAVEEDTIFNFLVRVYDELRNFGISPEERAINFAATNAYQAAAAFADGMRRRLELYRIGVKKSPICRPDSDRWDVQLVMFDPENERRAARFYRFTVDVSEILPVTVGAMRTWSAPLGSM